MGLSWSQASCADRHVKSDSCLLACTNRYCDQSTCWSCWVVFHHLHISDLFVTEIPNSHQINANGVSCWYFVDSRLEALGLSYFQQHPFPATRPVPFAPLADWLPRDRIRARATSPLLAQHNVSTILHYAWQKLTLHASTARAALP